MFVLLLFVLFVYLFVCLFLEAVEYKHIKFINGSLLVKNKSPFSRKLNVPAIKSIGVDLPYLFPNIAGKI